MNNLSNITNSSMVNLLSNMSFSFDDILQLLSLDNLTYSENSNKNKVLTIKIEKIPKLFDFGIISQEYNPFDIAFVFDEESSFKYANVQYKKENTDISFFVKVNEDIEYLDSYFSDPTHISREEKPIPYEDWFIFDSDTEKCIADIKTNKIKKRNDKIEKNKQYFIQNFRNDLQKIDGFFGIQSYIIEDINKYISDVAYNKNESKYHGQYYSFKDNDLELAFQKKLKKTYAFKLTVSAIASKIAPLNSYLNVQDRNNIKFNRTANNSNLYEELTLTIDESGSIRSFIIIASRNNINKRNAIFVYFDNSLSIQEVKCMDVVDQKIEHSKFSHIGMPLSDVFSLLKLKFNKNEAIQEIIPEMFVDGVYNFNNSNLSERLELVDLILY